MNTLTVLAPGMYAAGSYSLPPTQMGAGLSQAYIQFDATQHHDPTVILTYSWAISVDGGITWTQLNSQSVAGSSLFGSTYKGYIGDGGQVPPIPVPVMVKVNIVIIGGSLTTSCIILYA